VNAQRVESSGRSGVAGGGDPNFRPPLGLSGRHAQSILASIPLRKHMIRGGATDFLRQSLPKTLTVNDGIRLLGYHTPSAGSTKGLVVFLHGWEGSAESHYVLSASKTLHQAGFSVFRLNFRDHGNTYALNQGLFHSCRLDEVVDAIRCVQEHYHPRRLFLVGYSLGGNFALRAAVRAPSVGLRLSKIVAVCPVLRPHSTMKALEAGLWVYRHYYLRKWRRSLLAKAACFPDRYDFGDLRRFSTLTETTKFFVARYTEYSDMDAYLNGYAITGDVLSPLSLPTRLIAAADDPVVPSADLARIYRADVLDVTVMPRGGHCGFLTDYRLRSWADREILRELTAPEP